MRHRLLGRRQKEAARTAAASRDHGLGQAVAEFVLVAPLLLLILLLSLDMGRLFMGWITLNNSARVAANYAAMNATAWGAVPNSTVQAKYATLVNADIVGINCAHEELPAPEFPSGTSIGMPVKVHLDCRFDFVTPFIGSLFGGSLNMQAESVFPVRDGIVAGGSTAAPPLINLATATPTTGTAPLTVHFNASALNVVAWVWNYDDGTPEGTDGDTEDHTYTEPGVYHPTVVGYNIIGVPTAVYTVAEVTVTAPATDKASFTTTPNPVTGTAPVTVSFTDTSTPTPTSWAWTFGDGATSTNQSPSHTYLNGGTYTVKLVAHFPDGGTDSYSITFTITQAVPMCTVPNLVGLQTKNVSAKWSQAGFKTTVQFNPIPLNGYKVTAQYDGASTNALPVGASRPCNTQVVTVASGK